MAVYIITGKLGNGKTILSVGRLLDYVNSGRKVATNLDILVENFKDKFNRNVNIVRLPDKPNISDLNSIGRGHELDYPDESKNGLLLLDECGTWFNSRNWNDPARKDVIDWFLHARKLRWDVLLVIQDISLLDKQARDALAEHVVFVRRLDRLRIPLLGKITKMFGSEIRPPKIHIGIVKYGDTSKHLTVDKWWYVGSRLYDKYDTEQIFSSDYAGPYTYLTPWHLIGRYTNRKTIYDHANKILMPVIRLAVFYPLYYLYYRHTGPRANGGGCA